MWAPGATKRYLRHNGPNMCCVTRPRAVAKVLGWLSNILRGPKARVSRTSTASSLYELTAGWRQEHAHNKALASEPAASSGSCRFNPLAELRINTEYEVGDVQNLAPADG